MPTIASAPAKSSAVHKNITSTKLAAHPCPLLLVVLSDSGAPSRTERDNPRMNQITPVAFTIERAVDYSSVSRSTLYAHMKRGELKSFRVGGRRMIYRSAIDSFLANHAEAS